MNTPQTLMASLKRLFAEHRWRISATYLLSTLENFFNLLYPFATGMAINGLLKDEYFGLGLFLGTWMLHLAVGVLRQRYDTRVFCDIYAQLASRMVLSQHRAGVATTQIVARATLSREIVDFFERDIPLIITSLVSFVGAVIMLFFYDVQIGLACLALVMPISLLSRHYAKRTLHLNTQLNDQREREVAVLESGDPSQIKKHYNLLSIWQVRLSDAEATNWGMIESAMIGLAAWVIYRAVNLDDAGAGTIYAIIAYLWNFVSSLATVPFLVQQLSRLKDISHRVHEATDSALGDDDKF
ncbi:MAG: ABC transporter six-transmembrane domain-containing protein [Candidatus Melainabacteria bacterium]|nr:ABC transporter six-transmembrane domain-containing protein [Candidatus Melainabacteria bacterium]